MCTEGSNSDVVTIKYSQPTIIQPPILLTPQQNTVSEKGSDVFRTYHYPNPFSTYTNIRYELPHEGKIVVTLHDASGRKISTIVEGTFKGGVYSKRLNASTLSSGEYYYKVIF